MKVPYKDGSYVLDRNPNLYSKWQYPPGIDFVNEKRHETREERKQRLHFNIRLYRQYLIARDGFIGLTSLMLVSFCLFAAYTEEVTFADRGGSVALAILLSSPLLYRHIRRRTCAHLWQILTG